MKSSDQFDYKLAEMSWETWSNTQTRTMYECCDLSGRRIHIRDWLSHVETCDGEIVQSIGWFQTEAYMSVVIAEDNDCWVYRRPWQSGHDYWLDVSPSTLGYTKDEV